MTRWKRIRRNLVRLFPPILLVAAAFMVAAPAQAVRHTPHPIDAHHCMDIAAEHWGEQLPSDLIVLEGAAAAQQTQRVAFNRIYEIIWRQYNIAGARYNQWRWMRAWEEDGHVGCTWRGSKVHTSHGPSPYNPAWLG